RGARRQSGPGSSRAERRPRSSGFTDKFKDNLIKHVFQCYEEKREVGQFGLTTYSHWKDNRSPYIECHFHIDFREPFGFNVRKMNIKYGNEYGPIRSKEIPFSNNHEIPDRETVNRMMLERKRGMKI
ncbi:hypothetical protein L0152_20885, partial [bacterium]|nr:hypothetical protein [bacterium]